MGTWGAGLFSDDVAVDVRDEYVALLAQGVDANDAASTLQGHWAMAPADIEDATVFWLALAATQWSYGCLNDRVRDTAQALIAAGTDLLRWEGSPRRARRAAVLQALGRKLASPQPRRRKPRVRQLPTLPSLKVSAPDHRAVATAFPLAAHSFAAEPTMQVIAELDSESGRGGGSVFLARCPWDAVGLTWIDKDTLHITYPANAFVSQRKDSLFYAGRTLQVHYQERSTDPASFAAG